jgi:hypothetical protein
MKNATRVCQFLFSVIVVLLIIFPPYYAVDLESNGKTHTAMGYYPIWSTPTSKDAYYCLVNSGKIDAVVFENVITGKAITQYAAKFNTVRFILNFVIAGLFYSIILLTLKQLSKSKTG